MASPQLNSSVRYMEEKIARLPNWVRWVLLLPASLLGGFIAGFLIYAVWSAPAARPDAPIVLIAQFAAGIISVYATFYIAGIFAPSHEGMVVVALIAIELIAVGFAAKPVLTSKDWPAIALLTGNFVGCGVGWFQLVHKQRNHSDAT
jgi:hypothetical protein